MNPLLQSILGSVVRMALGGLVTWLIQKGVMQPEQTAAFYAAMTTGVAAIVWAIWHNVIEARIKNTAAALPPTPLDVVKTMVREKVFASANTPEALVPNVQSREPR